MTIEKKELVVAGRVVRIARLRHEWCDFLEDPESAVLQLQTNALPADLFTFVGEICEKRVWDSFYHEAASASVLKVDSFEEWWAGLESKVRNKIRKAHKSGVELRGVELDQDFARGVEAIYNESPVRQGRRFLHYGKKAAAIKEELSSFSDRCYFVGAYFRDEMIGFMKLFHGDNILRTVHIIAKLSHRDKPIMDALIAKAVEICGEKGIAKLQYGSWATGGLGAFRMKHGFQRIDVPRYFVPLNLRGEMMLKLKLHRSIKDRLPEPWVERLLAVRTRWNRLRYRPAERVV